jgi:hypothetical protein
MVIPGKSGNNFLRRFCVREDAAEMVSVGVVELQFADV